MENGNFLTSVKAGIESNATLSNALQNLKRLADVSKALDSDDADFVKRFFVGSAQSFPPLLWMYDFRAESFDEDDCTVTVSFNIGGPGGCNDRYDVKLNADMLNEQAFFRLESLMEQYDSVMKKY